jgi:hypothetical protein
MELSSLGEERYERNLKHELPKTSTGFLAAVICRFTLGNLYKTPYMFR